jgi:starch synthase
MKILFVASEAAPLAKVGGLADVAGSLPGALRALGEDVHIILPLYGFLDTAVFPLKRIKSGLEFNFGGENKSVDLDLTQNGKVPVYLVENSRYFGSGEVYANELERFTFFSRAVFEVLPCLDWQPDIIHCHDWLTAPLIIWLKRAGHPSASVFTIHNLAHQGFFDEAFSRRNNLDKEWEDLAPQAPVPPRCFLAQAILRADLVNTVSETYSREITTPEFGCGLDALLRYRDARGELSGILNGIDCEYWNPATDTYLPVKYDLAGFNRKSLNKTELQRTAGLAVNGDTPLIGMVQRMHEQKGIDILIEALDRMLTETGAQLVVQGRGVAKYEEALRQAVARYPRQAAYFSAYEESLAHLIYGGSDMYLMPSRFEPCGLSQMIAMHYGLLPIVRHTGGLVDSVSQFNRDLSRGSGFVFHDYTAAALLKAVTQAVSAFRDRAVWYRAAERVMQLDFSWQSSARKYLELYRRLR